MINRLIILGNGFDIAHGLKTKFSDFMEHYFSKIKDSGWKDEFFEFRFNGNGFIFRNCNNLNSIIQYLESSTGITSYYRPGNRSIDFSSSYSINVKNEFFYQISLKHSIQNWVDIENEYFNTLLEILDKHSHNKQHLITKLNSEMDIFSKCFEAYLAENVSSEIKNREIKDLIAILEDKHDFNDNKTKNRFLKEFPMKYLSRSSHDLLPTDNGQNYWRMFNKTYVLNFNYTSTFKLLYCKDSSFEVINIHGSINNESNPINLGFGDEMSKRYGEIEDHNENEYLRLMKSFAYSRTDNYKRLFDFIDTSDFQVYIMGHSCGISDRTLLNSIFENSNCKSIKIFYLERVREGIKNDNYSNLVMNISRHFNQKTMMRDKIVNKEYCQPLPQFE